MKEFCLRGYLPPSDVKNKADVMEWQEILGIKKDGMWGPKTMAAYESYTEEKVETDNVSRALKYKSRFHTDESVVLKMKQVESADLPVGTNKMVEFALQFDGGDTVLDHIDNAEKRLPYKDGLDFQSADCSSFIQSLYLLFFGIDIGSYTESQYRNYKHKVIPFKDRRPCDLIFWVSDTKKKKGRNVSHVALYIGDNKIIHTTSKSNPLRVESGDYWASNRVYCIRILSDEQYESLIVKPKIPDKIEVLKLTTPYIWGEKVEKLQKRLTQLGYGSEVGSADGVFGPKTRNGVIKWQKDNLVTGIVDEVTYNRLLA